MTISNSTFSFLGQKIINNDSGTQLRSSPFELDWSQNMIGSNHDEWAFGYRFQWKGIFFPKVGFLDHAKIK